MRTYKTVEVVETEEHLISIQCNVCGETIDLTGEYSFKVQDLHHIVIEGGYGTYYPGDMDRIEFDICGQCLHNLVGRFLIPVTQNREP